MSEKFVSGTTFVLSIYEMLQKQDLPGLLATVDPAVVIEQAGELPWNGRYDGVAGLKSFLGKIAQQIQSNVEIESYFETGNHVVVSGQTVGKTLGSGTGFRVRLVHIWTLKNEKVIRFEPYIDTPEMLRALTTPGQPG